MRSKKLKIRFNVPKLILEQQETDPGKRPRLPIRGELDWMRMYPLCAEEHDLLESITIKNELRLDKTDFVCGVADATLAVKHYLEREMLKLRLADLAVNPEPAQSKREKADMEFIEKYPPLKELYLQRPGSAAAVHRGKRGVVHYISTRSLYAAALAHNVRCREVAVSKLHAKWDRKNKKK